ncbi:hypothetical protein RHGRI_003561 [Rhododendron griersonianum]|uniref:Uncharacterized protein n=1 Tax=Rhododendron griersonianum TaxID=479676 RepID=A0AAV6L5H3_9ERIC|nr:hypothetical protein RHGRI_003561 [Rhododendron griersonianum]
MNWFVTLPKTRASTSRLLGTIIIAPWSCQTAIYKTVGDGFTREWIEQNDTVISFPTKIPTVSSAVQWQGLDGLQGPIVSGTGFYIKREALYANPIKDVDVMELKQYFGPSNEFIKSFGRHYKPKDHQHSASVTLMKETQYLASCAYENETKWGKEASPKQILPSIP